MDNLANTNTLKARVPTIVVGLAGKHLLLNLDGIDG